MSAAANARLAMRLSLLLTGCLALSTLLLLSSPVLSQTPAEIKYIPLALKVWRPDTPHGHLLITEVLYNPTGDETQSEWVEIASFAGTAISLEGIKIGDATSPSSGEGMHVFPPGAVLHPGRALVIASYASTFKDRYGRFPDFELNESDPGVPNLLRYDLYPNKKMNLNNDGDEVVLLDQEDTVIDLVSWGNSTGGLNPPVKAVPDGSSLERYPSHLDNDRAEDWVAQPEPNPGVLKKRSIQHTATPESGNSPPPPVLLISEVLFNPTGNEPEGEWIEIYNPGPSEVDLSGCQVGDEETAGGPEGMLAFPPGSRLPARKVMIIANQARSFTSTYGFPPDFEMTDSDPNVPDLIKGAGWGSGSVNLNNAEDEVLLLDAYNRPLDSLSWGASKVFLDPPAPLPPEGQSLERYPASQDTDQASDWLIQPMPAPGIVRAFAPTPSPTFTASPKPSVTPTPTITPTPTATLPRPPANYLLISEIIHSPNTGPNNSPLLPEGFSHFPDSISGDGEWIEIYNPTSQTIDLSDYKIGDEETRGGDEGMYRFPPGSVIEPGEVILIGNTATSVLQYYRVLPDFEFYGFHPEVPNMIPYPEWADGMVTLNHLMDEVLLLNENDEVVDAVTYGFSTSPYCIPNPLTGEGPSLERFPPDRDTDDCSVDFIIQFDPTPGRLPVPHEGTETAPMAGIKYGVARAALLPEPHRIL